MLPKELEPFSALVTTRLGNNPIFSSIKDATLLDLLPAHQAFSDARLDYAVHGGNIPKALLVSTHLTLVQQLYFGSIKVEDLAKGDVEIINASGFITRKTTRADSNPNPKETHSIDAPSKFKVTDVSDKPGFVLLTWMRVLGSRTYAIEKRPRGSDAVWKNGDYTSNTSIELSGFESDSVMEFRIRTHGKGETKSDFTPAVGVLVT
jgi:hypothetical protein